MAKPLSFITLTFIGFTLFLSSCGEEEEEATSTSVKIPISFSNVTAEGKYVVKITVTAPDIDAPITANQNLAIQSGSDPTYEITVGDIPAGDNRIVEVEILKDGTVVFEGSGVVNLSSDGGNGVPIITVNPPGHKLVATFKLTASDSGNLKNGYVKVDASASHDTHYEIKDVKWDWGDGEQTAYNKVLTAEYTYTSSGAYTITLTVRNNAPVSVTAGQEKTIAVTGKEEITWETDGATMQLIPAGEFEMGDQHLNEGFGNELPIHPVFLDAFYIDETEVTNAMYAKFLNAVGKHVGDDGTQWLEIGAGDELIELVDGQHRPKAGFADHPVIEVSWYGAAAYAQWSGKRLPTEAEWEKAARGGLAGNRYPWGNAITHDDANYDGTGGGDQWEQTAPVGSFPPNGYGLHDMAGNVWEWCMDEWDHGFYANSPKKNPIAGGPVAFVDNKFTDVTTRRAVRGGSWAMTKNAPNFLRAAARNSGKPSETKHDVGFRCAVTR